MENVNPQDQAAESVFDVVIPSIGKRFGECTGTELKRLSKRLKAAGEAALRRGERLTAHAEGRTVIPKSELRQLLSEARQVDPDLVATARIQEILERQH